MSVTIEVPNRIGTLFSMTRFFCCCTFIVASLYYMDLLLLLLRSFFFWCRFHIRLFPWQITGVHTQSLLIRECTKVGKQR